MADVDGLAAAMKSLLVFEGPGGLWSVFLEKYFSDVSVRLIRCADKHAAASFFDRVSPAAVFIEPSFLNLSLIQKIKVRCQTDPLFRVYRIGPQASAKNDIFFHTIFDQPVPHEFEKKWPETLPLPDIVKLLVIDDEQEIGSMVRDYSRGGALRPLRYVTR